MSRYIDAEALLAELQKDANAFDDEAEDARKNSRNYTDGDLYSVMGRADGIRDAMMEVYDAPSIDLADYVPKDFHDKTCEEMAKRHQEEIANMVSVVRCKECKEWDKNDHECYLDRGGLYFPNADDFCSYGVRKGADDE